MLHLVDGSCWIEVVAELQLAEMIPARNDEHDAISRGEPINETRQWTHKSTKRLRRIADGENDDPNGWSNPLALK